MTEKSPLDLGPCIREYHNDMKRGGYAATTLYRRLKHLHYLQAFVKQQGLTSLEDFRPQQSADFIDYWLRHNPAAKTSTGFNRKSRFEPRHHIGLQYTLRSFFRWARSVGYLKRDPFPVRESVRGNYFFAQTTEYLDFCQEHKGLAKNTLNQIELFLRRFDHFLHSHEIHHFNQMQIRHIDRFVREQASHNVRRIQRVHKILRAFLRYLFSRGQLQRDWASALHSPRQYRLAHTPRPLASHQVLALLRSIDREKPPEKRDFAVILLAASLGVRCSEIAHLRLRDLDWKGQRVRFEQAKNRHLLHMPLSRPLIEALVDYLKNERPANSSHPEVFLRLTAPRGPLHPGSVSGLIAKRMRQAGLATSAHQLRHAFASELLRAGVGYSTLQELLGHRHLTSTHIYTKIDLSQLREVAENDAQDY